MHETIIIVGGMKKGKSKEERERERAVSRLNVLTVWLSNAYLIFRNDRSRRKIINLEFFDGPFIGIDFISLFFPRNGNYLKQCLD